MKYAPLLTAIVLAACSRGSYEGENDTGGPGSGGSSNQPVLPQNVDFVARAEFEGPCERETVIDVNLGNSPEAFVRAAQCQINGAEPDAATVSQWSQQLRTVSWVRRIDIVRSLCAQAGRQCSLGYSDPWQAQVELTTPCERKGTRDVGAVMMYWGECPNGVNCGMDWANTHASGMNAQHPLFGFANTAQGFYNPQNPGFWRRELLDAKWAGLSFFLLNTFGPDMSRLGELAEALDDVGAGVKIALFDDTWGWGRGQAPWSQLPTFDDAEAAAQLIYQNKWKPFHAAIPSEHWYRIGDRPLIYFYNAGTLKPENKAAATLSRLKALFQADHGVEPFLAVDRAFFQDPATPDVADAEFRWNTFSNDQLSHSDMKGTTLDHFMVKWDSIGRDGDGRIATEADQILKGPELLSQYLEASAASNLAVIATWNDLGEGTGISRNYDYFHQGSWLAPNAFMRLIRSSQCSN